jgi:predicted MFS family arabinose efflux permease
VVSRSSDKTGDRKFHLAGVYLLAAVAMLGSAYVHSPVLAFVFLCIVGFSLNAGNPLFWSINASLLTGAAGAASIAMVNTLAQFGGLIGPWCIGLIKDSTGSFSWALVGIAGFLIVASAIAATMRVKPRETGLTHAIPSSATH